MRRFVIMRVSVDCPEYVDEHEVEDHMMSHRGVTRFFLDPDRHIAVLVFDRKKTNWAKTKHDMEEEGLHILDTSITGVQ